jgi:hypothetical protein
VGFVGSVVEGVEVVGEGEVACEEEEVRARFRDGCWCESSLSSSWVYELGDEGAGEGTRNMGSMYVVDVTERDIIGDN